MWTIAKLEIENLFSYRGKHHLDFSGQDSTYLVCGINSDDPGTDSNGAGKSSLFDAVSWILFGKAPRSNKLPDIISRGEAKGGGTVVLTTGEDSISVSRHRSVDGKKNDLRVFTESYDDPGGQHDQSLRTPSLTQKQIHKLLGFDDAKAWEDYLSKVYFTTSTTRGFLSSDIGPTDRQRTLERYLQLGLLDDAVKMCREKRKGLDSKVETLDSQISILGAPGAESIGDIKQRQVELQAELEAMEAKAKQVKDEYDKLAKELEMVRDQRGVISTAKALLQQLEASAADIRSRYQAALAEETEASASRAAWQEKEPRFKELQLLITTVKEEKSPDVESRIKDLESDLRATNLQLTHLTTKIQEVESYKVKPTEEMVKLQGELSRSKKILEDMSAQLTKQQICPSCGAPTMVVNGAIKSFDPEALQSDITDREVHIAGQLSNLAELTKSRDADVMQQLQDLRQSRSTLETLRGEQQEKLSQAAEEKRKLVQQHTIALQEFNELDKVRQLASNVQAKSGVILGEGVILNSKIRDAREQVMEAEKTLDTMLGGRDILLEKDSHNGQLCHLDSQVLRLKMGLQAAADDLNRAEEAAVKITMLKDLRADAQEKIKVWGYWEKAFPEVKQLALETFIPSFEATVNKYLEQFGVREQIDCQLDGGFSIQVYDGEYWRDFETYSAGERARILVACGYALRDLSTFSASGTLGFLFVDELLDSMDTTGIDSFFELSMGVPGQKFVITHSKPDEVRSKADALVLVHRYQDKSAVEIQR